MAIHITAIPKDEICDDIEQEINGDNTLAIIEECIFITDQNGDTVPSSAGELDDFFEIISNEIVPKL